MKRYACLTLVVLFAVGGMVIAQQVQELPCRASCRLAKSRGRSLAGC